MQLSEKCLAKLLGLKPDDLKRLKHGPLLPEFNNHGQTVSYYIHISPDNSQELLQKLKMQNCNFKVFNARAVERFLK